MADGGLYALAGDSQKLLSPFPSWGEYAMESEHRISFIGLSLTVILLLASCRSVGVHRVHGRGGGYGPPAHAPAHGYRHKHVYGYDLVYDSSYGFYVVTGLNHHYYHDGYFYRLHGDVWQVSLRGADWRPLRYGALPSPLRVKFKPAAPSRNLNAVIKTPGSVAPVIKTSGPTNIKVKGKAKGRGKGKK